MILIPMAGLSSRFSEAGYTQPKFMLPLHGRPVFDYALWSFHRQFGKERLVLAILKDDIVEQFIRERLRALNVDGELVFLDEPTRGQAHTVSLALEKANVDADESVTIFNIDSFHFNFLLRPQERNAAAYLEAFVGQGDGWSFVEPIDENSSEGKVKRVVEKERVSKYCSTGLYHFSSRALFDSSYQQERDNPSQQISEDYIAPIYNQITGAGLEVLFRTVDADDVVFCGIPAEYESLLDDKKFASRVSGLLPSI
ncbi:MAG: NTP transferase domain-containing protein [Alphaproteobacteria bacterium]|nr:NTP transferase domain-containing protein [Alphaproteobacteria bacterium]